MPINYIYYLINDSFIFNIYIIDGKWECINSILKNEVNKIINRKYLTYSKKIVNNQKKYMKIKIS